MRHGTKGAPPPTAADVEAAHHVATCPLCRQIAEDAARLYGVDPRLIIVPPSQSPINRNDRVIVFALVIALIVIAAIFIGDAARFF